MSSDFLFKAKKFVKDSIPFLTRLLIISAFIQDSIDVMDNIKWPSQFSLIRYVLFFYQCNIIFSSLVCSILIILNQLVAPCTACLTGFSFVSLFVYHNFKDAIITTRRVSVLGGLFLLMAKSLENKKVQFKIGLPDVPMISKATYLQLAGRIMITFLFITQVLISNNQSTIERVIMIVIGIIGFIMIGIGYKVRYVCSVLCVAVILLDFYINPFWDASLPKELRRILRFEFFQMLGVSGSLLLLANDGAGELSMDEKKKNY